MAVWAKMLDTGKFNEANVRSAVRDFGPNLCA